MTTTPEDATFQADAAQADAAVQTLTEWAHRDFSHGENHAADVQELLSGMDHKQLAQALMIACMALSLVAPSACQADEL